MKPVPRRAKDAGELPPSFAQERLWLVDRFARGQPAASLAFALRLRGGLDAAALERALDDLAERHEALRTRLVSVDGRPVQVVDPPAPRGLPVDDLREGGAALREARLRVLAAREAARPPDLAAGPPLRARLLRLSGDEHVLLATAHQAVFDTGSIAVFARDLAALYAARTSGLPACLPEVPVQLADHARWQRGRLRGEALGDAVERWRAALEGVSPVSAPADRPRPRLRSFEGRIARLDVGQGVRDGLERLARERGTTLPVALLAAVQVLLHRYNARDDVTVGAESDGRDRPELAPLIGRLADTLPVRTDLSGDPTFADLLRRVHTAATEAEARRDLPFAAVVEALRIERDPGGHPVYRVAVAMAGEPGQELRAGDVTIRAERLDLVPALLDLDLTFVILPLGLRVDLCYATALFDEATARQLLDHLGVLLAGIAAGPRRRLSRLPLLTAADRRRELVEWNDTAADRLVTCVHQSFEAQAVRTPDAVAAVFEDERWTYAELNAHANRVARRLRGRDVRPETLVGICMRPSLRRLAAILGVMKAGGGYVPLDPELPAGRLAYMVGDAAMPVILVDGGAPEVGGPGVAAVDLDADWPAIAGLPARNADHPVSPDNVAYVIYTSGSTGRPKGVVVQHATVVNYLTGIIRSWSVGPPDRWLQFASLSFDVSVMDMFVTLCSGATAVLGSAETLHSPPRLADLMRRHRVTFACIPPAVVSLLADQSLPDLRVLISAGEALSSELVHRWLRPGLAFCNGYGPTETTCGVTIGRLGPTTSLPPPIGTPLPNYRAYVLDAHLDPVPLGVTGELHVGGACMARGYRNQARLTAERFVPDPYGDVPGSRLYRTGDLVRRLPDGSIRFVGRADAQVKIRAQRVELGEIETVLAAHPAVAQAVVVAAGSAGQQRLVGYASTRPGVPSPPAAELRQHLARQLPSYMVPAHVVLVDAFPLTNSGKIDHRALPEPEGSGAAHAAARTRLEARLLAAYESLLGQPGAGIDDGFFDLGGDSLQAMRLIARLHDDLGVEVDAGAIFLAPTPRRLAAHLRERHGVEDGEIGAGRLVELAAGERPLFIVHAVGGTVFPYARLAQELAGHHRVYGVEAAGLRPGSAPAGDLDAMAADYSEAIRGAQPAGPYRLAGWSMGGPLAFEIAKRLEALGETVALLVLLDAPCRAPAGPPATEAELAALFVADGARTLGMDADEPAGLASRPAADQLGWLAGRLDGGSGNLGAVRAEIERRFAVFEANRRAIAGYRPAPAVHAPALIVSSEATAGSAGSAAGWRTVMDGAVEILRIPGDHWTLLRPPAVVRLAAAMLRAR